MNKWIKQLKWILITSICLTRSWLIPIPAELIAKNGTTVRGLLLVSNLWEQFSPDCSLQNFARFLQTSHSQNILNIKFFIFFPNEIIQTCHTDMPIKLKDDVYPGTPNLWPIPGLHCWLCVMNYYFYEFCNYLLINTNIEFSCSCWFFYVKGVNLQM